MTRTGRPKSDNPKSVKYSIRLEAETEARLQAFCEENGITKGEAFRRGIELLMKHGGRKNGKKTS